MPTSEDRGRPGTGHALDRVRVHPDRAVPDLSLEPDLSVEPDLGVEPDAAVEPEAPAGPKAGVGTSPGGRPPGPQAHPSWRALRDRVRHGPRRHAGFRLPWALVAGDIAAFVATVALVEDASRRVLVMGALTLLLLWNGGLYRSRLTPSVLDDAPSLVGRALVAGAVVTGLGAFDDGRAGRITLEAAAVLAALLLVARMLVHSGTKVGRRRGRLAHRTLILGGGDVAGHVARILQEHREIGLQPVGFLDDDPLLPPAHRPVPHLGGYDRLVDVILEERITNVVVAFGSMRELHVVDVLRECDRMACEIFFVPRLYELHAMHRDMEIVWGIPLVRIRRAPFRTPVWRLKRLMDVAGSAVALVLLAPLLAACALAVRLSVGRPLVFRQERVGLDGRPFTLLKFCTLPPATPGEAAERWDVSDDERLTRVGRLMRRTSLDELPQLWNILRGDMSLVGPRPERPYFVDSFRTRFPRYMARHRVPAGLTGAAQVAGLRGNTSIADRARFDNLYIENWSLWEDCKWLLRTVGQVVRATGR